MALLEERKRRLQAEGLFDTRRKRRLPFMPCVIGVVTSPTGSVIRDIIHRIKDRFPLHVLVWPVRVQGDTAGAEVTNAVTGFNALAWDGTIRRPDVLIVARGGGSLEDLWGFNDETLARAVAASGIPVISAVGHETDWTLIDLVADMRAPTPTGAAEMAVPVKADLEATLASLGARLKAAVLRNFERKRQAARGAARALPSPDQLLALPRRRLDEATSRLGRGLTVSTDRKRARLVAVKLTPAMLSQRIAEARRTGDRNLLRAQSALRALTKGRRHELRRAADQLPKCAKASLQRHRQQLALLQGRITIEPTARRHRVQRDLLTALTRRGTQAVVLRLERLRGRVSQAERLMSTLSHKAVLARGFALVKDADGAVIKQAAGVFSGMALVLEFADGTADAVATSGAARPKPVAKPVAKTREPGSQGSLF
jgi:exodeoxyribonuclease VII large subunit